MDFALTTDVIFVIFAGVDLQMWVHSRRARQDQRPLFLVAALIGLMPLVLVVLFRTVFAP